MSPHRTATREEWTHARLRLLEREKAHTRAGDELARERRELPWVPVERDYIFQTAEGAKRLVELFDGRTQLVIYHFMFGPDWDAGCPACSVTADGFDGVLPHLRARDVTMICVSRASVEKLLAFRERMGWTFEWASSLGSDFNVDFGVSAADARAPGKAGIEANELGLLRLLNEQPELRADLPPVAINNAAASGAELDSYFAEGHGFSTFAREGDAVFHCYSTYARGTEFLMEHYPILDRVPKGRDEGDAPMSWLRFHDEYGEAERA